MKGNKELPPVAQKSQNNGAQVATPALKRQPTIADLHNIAPSYIYRGNQQGTTYVHFVFIDMGSAENASKKLGELASTAPKIYSSTRDWQPQYPEGTIFFRVYSSTYEALAEFAQALDDNEEKIKSLFQPMATLEIPEISEPSQSSCTLQ